MIDKEYGLNSETNAISAEFRNDLFSTKEIDLEGKYINIRNLNAILKEILDTLYDYYKGKTLQYVDEQLYPKGSVFEYNGDLFYVLRDYTDDEIGVLEEPKESEIFKLLTPNVPALIEEARAKLQNNIDLIDQEHKALISDLDREDEILHDLITQNTNRFENLLAIQNNHYQEMNEEFSLFKEVLKEHGIINDQEDNFITELQNHVQNIISVNERQDTDIENIKAKNIQQDEAIEALSTDYNTFKANTQASLENDDLRIKALQNTDSTHDTLLANLRNDHDNLRTEYDAHISDYNDYKTQTDSEIDSLDSRVDSLEEHQTTDRADIDTLRADVDTLTTDLSTEVELQKTNNEAQEGLINDIKEDVKALQAKDTALEEDLDNYKYEANLKMDTSYMEIGELRETTENHETRLTSLEGRADTTDTHLTALDEEDKLIRDFLERLEENVGTNNSIISDIQDRYENMQNNHTEMRTYVETNMEEWSTEKAQLEAEHEAIQANIDEVNEKITTGELSKQIHDTLYSTITDEVNKAETRINANIDESCAKTKDDLYSEMTGAGREGEFLQIKFNEKTGRSEIQSSGLVNFSKIATTQEAVDALKLEPVGMSTVFNTWYRFSHWRGEQNISGNTGHDMGGHMNDCPNNWSGWEHETARNKWSYDPSTKMIKSNRNSPVYGAFVSPRKLANWYLKLLAYGGGDGDNDGILINLAYMKGEDGVEHTIDLVRAVMGKGNGIYLDQVQMRHQWSIVYDYNMSTEFELATNTYIKPKSGGWGTQYCCFSAQRTKTTFKCYTSDIVANRIEEVDPKSEISWTLPLTKPSNYSDAMYANLKIMMDNPAQMGVGAHSQNGLFTILDQKYIFDDEKIYDFVSNNIWEYDEPSRLWNSVGKCSDLFDGFVYSRITGDLFYLDNGKAINLNNASSTVKSDELSATVAQLGEEITQKDSEVLQSANAHTDEEVQALTNRINELETRLKAVEDVVNLIDFVQVNYDGETYDLLAKKVEVEESGE